MATTFAYKVRDQHGQLIEGTLDASSRELVTSKLREMGYSPLEVREKRKNLLQTEFKLGGSSKVKIRDLAVMARQLSTMITAGMPLIRALNVLKEQTENKTLITVITEIRGDIERGMSFHQAIDHHGAVFPPLFSPMIKAGETGGVLDAILNRLARTLEKQAELRGKVRSAMAYPVMVGVMVVLIATGMLVFIVPRFESIYESLDGTLPTPTRILLAISKAMTNQGPIIVLLLVIAVFGFRRWIGTKKGRMIFDGFKLKAPIFGPLASKAAIARFARTLSSLVRAGVPMMESLSIVANTSGNRVIQDGVETARERVRHGSSMSASIADHRAFPPMVIQMMAVGEETGALDEMLEKMADFYEEEVEATVNALTSLIEPLLMVFMGVVVGGMIIALYMPIFKLITIVK
jgi:type IV pilus assembly protein PilC